MDNFTKKCITILFVLSGLTSLVYEIVWTRILILTLGGTDRAISIILASFFGGMALGALFFAGKHVKRPIFVYGIFELAIGIYGILSLFLFDKTIFIYSFLVKIFHFGPAGAPLFQFFSALSILIIPTFFMGATFPLLIRGFDMEKEKAGLGTATLYFANTLGAALGTYIAGFYLLPAFGLNALFIVASLNILIFLFSFALDKRTLYKEGAIPEKSEKEMPARRNYNVYIIYCALLFSGITSICYEILWTKLNILVVSGTIYGFSMMLTTFLLGIGIGSLVYHLLRNRGTAFGINLYISFQLIIGLSALTAYPLSYLAPELNYLISESFPDATLTAIHIRFVFCFLVMFLPALLYGFLFPFSVELLVQNGENPNTGASMAYAVTTAGNILGSFAAPYLLYKSFGLNFAYFYTIVANVIIALILSISFKQKKLLAASLVLLCLLPRVNVNFDLKKILATGLTIWYSDSRAQFLERVELIKSRIAVVQEGENTISTLAITKSKDQASFSVYNNGIAEAAVVIKRNGDVSGGIIETWMGVIPSFLRDNLRNACLIGLGAGGTLLSLEKANNFEEITVIEYEKKIVDLVHTIYPPNSEINPLNDKRVRLEIADGRNYLYLNSLISENKFDAIVSQPSRAWLTGSANLFTKEFMQISLDNLSEQGLFIQWFNLARMDEEALSSILKAFSSVFPHHLVINNRFAEIMLIGSREPLKLDFPKILEKYKENHLVFKQIDLNESDILSWIGFSSPILDVVTSRYSSPFNSDNNLYVEGRIGKLAYAKQTGVSNTVKNVIMEMHIPARQKDIMTFNTMNIKRFAKIMLEFKYSSLLRQYISIYKNDLAEYLPQTYLIDEDFYKYRDILFELIKTRANGKVRFSLIEDLLVYLADINKLHVSEAISNLFDENAKKRLTGLKAFLEDDYKTSLTYLKDSQNERILEYAALSAVYTNNKEEFEKLSDSFRNKRSLALLLSESYFTEAANVPNKAVSYRNFFRAFNTHKKQYHNKLKAAAQKKNLSSIEYYLHKLFNLEKSPYYAASLSAFYDTGSDSRGKVYYEEEFFKLIKGRSVESEMLFSGYMKEQTAFYNKIRKDD